jgi:hypothetical protein
MPQRLKVAEAETKETKASPLSGAMNAAGGLRGKLAQNVGQLSAVAVVCTLLVWSHRDTAEAAREDRGMFREELKAQRDDHQRATDKLADKLDGVRSAVEVNTRTVERAGRIGKAGMAPGVTSPVPRDQWPAVVPRVMPGPASIYRVKEMAPEPRHLGE